MTRAVTLFALFCVLLVGYASCECIPANCNAPWGRCLFPVDANTTLATCRCVKGRVDVRDEPPGRNSTCAYKQKEKLTAFLLSFFVGWTGADRFYLDYDAKGAGKLVLFLSIIVLGCAVCCISCATGGRTLTAGFSEREWGASAVAIACLSCLSMLIALGLAAWCLSDWIRIITDRLDDANGYALEDW